jgi:kinetochore protein Spc25
MTHTLRLPQIDLASVLTHPNPQIDLRIAAYETSTRNFLKAVSNYKNRAIATISDRRITQAAEKKKIADKTQAVEVETNQCKVAEIALVAGKSICLIWRELECGWWRWVDLEREQEERKDAELSVAAFKRRLASLRDKCASIDAEIEQYRAITANIQRGVCVHFSVFFLLILTTEQRKRRNDQPWANTLHASRPNSRRMNDGCVVSWKESRRTGFWFGFRILTGLNRSASLALCSIFQQRFIKVCRVAIFLSLVRVLIAPDVTVLTSTPVLPTLPSLVEELNDSGDIYGFVRRVRRAFEELVKDGSWMMVDVEIVFLFFTGD